MGKTNNTDLKTKQSVEFVCLACCTCKRPIMLEKSLASVSKLIIPQGIRIELVIIDNDEQESAKNTVEEIRKDIKIPLHYVVQKERGLSKARNTAIEEVIKLGATHILFFDDDEILDEKCLSEHIKLYQNSEKAIISTGPTTTIFIDELPNYITKNIVFKQKTSKKTGQVINHSACGNVFFPVSIVKEHNLRFSSEYVFMGGEDGDFFQKAFNLGYIILWNNDAIIYEMVSKSRGNLRWIFKKCYYNGYAGNLLKFKNEKSYLKKLLFIFKHVLVICVNIVLLIPSLLFGLPTFFNLVGIIIRTKGKIDAIIKTKPIDFYRNISGE